MSLSPFTLQRPTRRGAGLALLAATVLAGCASLAPQTPEEQVRQRAEARWAALVKRDFDTAYTYAPPSFRAVVPQSKYGTRFGSAARWKGVQVHEVRCEPERCTVKLRVETEVLRAPFTGHVVTTYFDEVWVREDAQWWRYEERF